MVWILPCIILEKIDQEKKSLEVIDKNKNNNKKIDINKHYIKKEFNWDNKKIVFFKLSY